MSVFDRLERERAVVVLCDHVRRLENSQVNSYYPCRDVRTMENSFVIPVNLKLVTVDNIYVQCGYVCCVEMKKLCMYRPSLCFES